MPETGDATLNVTSVMRHRPLTASCWLLFACVFLPAYQACGTDIVPIREPVLWPPYLHGLVLALVVADIARPIAVAAAWRLARRAAVVSTLWALRTVLFVVADPIFLGMLAVEALALVALGSRPSAGRVARHAVVLGLGYAVFFGSFLCDPSSRYGLVLAFIASVGICVGGLRWAFDDLGPR